MVVQRLEYAGIGSGFGLSLGFGWDGRILGGFIISSQPYEIGLLF